jgi:cellulose synthase/poly-beta-1,6-N-acetylglucosamine synthase-like glycosyltransferase
MIRRQNETQPQSCSSFDRANPGSDNLIPYSLMVSILIAARNEEANILPCLEAVAGLDWPAGDLEVWIGNDQSEDATAALVAGFIRDKPHFHLLDVTTRVGDARGKSNVLAQLAARATGDYLFFTDADVRVPPTWIRSMLAARERHVGIVNGVTLVAGESLPARLQAVEWTYAISLMRRFARRKIPITAMGNNMMTTREAYRSTGGYERLPFSITEDYQLFRHILAKGFGFRQAFDPGVLAFTAPAESLRHLLQQRKRWMTGAMQLPWYQRMFVFAEALLVPAVVALCFYSPLLALGVFALRATLIVGEVHGALRAIGQQGRFRDVWPYLPYHFLVVTANVLYYLLPVPVVWKGRRY